VLTYRFIAESRDSSDRGFDTPGQLLFIVGIGALTFGLIQGPQSGWGSLPIVLSFAVATAVLTAFVVTELRTRAPMMEVRVFTDRVYTAAIYTVFASLFCVYGTLLVVTQYFQNVRDYSPEEAGLLMLAFTLPTVVLSPIAGRVVAARGGRSVALFGVACAVVGTGILAVSDASQLAVTLIGLAFVGSTGGTAVAAATSVAMSGISPERSGMASGILSSQRALGSTAGFAIMGSVLAVTVATILPGKLEPLIPSASARDDVVDRVVDDANPNAVTSLIGPGKPLPDRVREDDEVLAVTDDAFVTGIRVAMVVGCAVAISALVLGWFLFPRRRERDPVTATPGGR
jgi:drug/metabolite transporter superfamily protein YnfA